MVYLIVKVPEAIIVNHHVGGDPSWRPPEGHIEVKISDDVPFNIGWLWNGEKPVDPNPSPPKSRGRMNEIS